MLFGQCLRGEAARHRRVLDRLHFDRVGRLVPLQLGHNQLARAVQAEYVEAVSVDGVRGHPLVELHRHDHDLGPENLRMGDHPLLEVLTLLQTSLGEGELLGRGGRRAVNGEQQLFGHLIESL